MFPIKDVTAYYESLWGKPSRVMKFHGAGQRIRVLKWDQDATDVGGTLYATVGASHGKQRDPHRVEFILAFRPEDDRAAKSLAALATFPPVHGPVGKGETVTLADPVFPGTDIRTLLVIPEVEEFIPPVKLKDHHVEFLRVLPIHPSELELKKELGGAWLMNRIHDQGIRLSDPARRPATRE